jgi:hypothetical protein
MTSAVTPGFNVPPTMTVFRDRSAPHLIPLLELEEAMKVEGYALSNVDSKEVLHGKKMVACWFRTEESAKKQS